MPDDPRVDALASDSDESTTDSRNNKPSQPATAVVDQEPMNRAYRLLANATSQVPLMIARPSGNTVSW